MIDGLSVGASYQSSKFSLFGSAKMAVIKGKQMSLENPARIISTMLNSKPHPRGKYFSMFLLLGLVGFSYLFWTDLGGVAKHLPVSLESLRNGEIWRTFTASLIHSGPRHLVSNSLMLVIFTYMIVGYFGVRVYLFAYVILGSIVNYLTVLTYNPKVNLLGASGVVYVLAGMWFSLYLGIERRFGPGKRLLRSTGVMLVVLFPTTFEPTTSYRAHAIGFAVGVLGGFIYWFINRHYFSQFEVIKVEEPGSEEETPITWH